MSIRMVVRFRNNKPKTLVVKTRLEGIALHKAKYKDCKYWFPDHIDKAEEGYLMMGSGTSNVRMIREQRSRMYRN